MERASRYSPEVRERAVRMVLVQEKVDFHRPPCPERTSTCRSAIGAGSNRSGSPYCPDPQQRPHGLASGHRVQPAQPDRNADRSLEERDRPQAQIPQLLQADHGNQGRPESSEHNDRTRTACVRTHRLTLPLGKGRIPSSAPIHATTLGDTFLLGYPPARFQIVATRSSINALRIGGANMD